jgi:NDP-sugar pyrophosphorylase family protein
MAVGVRHSLRTPGEPASVLSFMGVVDGLTMICVPAGVVLLAAGTGRRLAALTENTHKSLLPVAGRPALQYAVDELLAAGVEDIVVVTGDKHQAIENFVHARYDDRITLAFNDRYAVDTNILSTAIGVAALRRQDAGYLIIETDLVVAPAGWLSMLDVGDGSESFWVTHGAYSPALTGGALNADVAGRVTDLIYAPEYTPTYEGWQKLLGALYVGRNQVMKDRELRQLGIDRTIAQYYMMPWVEHLPQLPCRARSLGNIYAASFNDIDAYQQAGVRFAEVLGAAREPA